MLLLAPLILLLSPCSSQTAWPRPAVPGWLRHARQLPAEEHGDDDQRRAGHGHHGQPDQGYSAPGGQQGGAVDLHNKAGLNSIYCGGAILSQSVLIVGLSLELICLQEFCVDVSAFLPVVWVERAGEMCKTEWVQQCQQRTEEVCQDVAETRCQVR